MSVAVGERVELARYEIDGSQRVLYGQRVNGVVRVVDKPRTGHGRSYLVERELTSNAELEAIVADYVCESKRRGEPAVIVRVGDDLVGRCAETPV